MNIIGGIGAVIVRLLGYKPVWHGKAMLFRLGKNWGGVCLGMFIFVSETMHPIRFGHEYGHSIQNAVYGFLFPFIVAIPSVVRCAYWNIMDKDGNYDSVWFEKQATEWGDKYA